MNADKVEHRGIAAFQSMYNDTVLLVKDGKVARTIHTNGLRKTADELRQMIDEYLEGR